MIRNLLPRPKWVLGGITFVAVAIAFARVADQSAFIPQVCFTAMALIAAVIGLGFIVLAVIDILEKGKST